MSSFYGFQNLGLFQSQAEADAWPTYGDYNAPGKFKVADINNDGVIDDDDRTIIGSPHPDFTYGINVNVAYKEFDLSIFATGVQGNDLFNANKLIKNTNKLICTQAGDHKNLLEHDTKSIYFLKSVGWTLTFKYQCLFEYPF